MFVISSQNDVLKIRKCSINNEKGDFINLSLGRSSNKYLTSYIFQKVTGSEQGQFFFFLVHVVKYSMTSVIIDITPAPNSTAKGKTTLFMGRAIFQGSFC